MKIKTGEDNSRGSKLPSIIVTGASGIVGRAFLEAAKDRFFIYAICRRSQKESGVPSHPNIKWIQVDIGNWLSMRWVMHNIKRSGGADFILHLAAYYDFEYTPNPEYERTNVNGTRYMLEQAKILRVKRFIFASSTAASQFPAHGAALNEDSPVDADYDYAISKHKGEEMIHEFSDWFPCSVVRFAAVFSDWCEYGVLYVFLSTWLSKRWDARILGGRGESAVPYIHTDDLNKLLLTIIDKTNSLPQDSVFIASPDGSTSHRELFEAATRFYFGKRVRPIYIPKLIALPGVIGLDLLGRLFRKRPFIRPWMIKYLDYKLAIDAAETRKMLSWAPTPRYHILRRLLYLIERMKHDPFEWHRKNRAALKRVAVRPNLLIYEVMTGLREEVVEAIEKEIYNPAKREVFPNYNRMPQKIFHYNLDILFQLIASSVRNNDRILLLDYIRDVANLRIGEGFLPGEICQALLLIGEFTTKQLRKEPALKKLNQEIYDQIIITIQMMIDEVENVYEHFDKATAPSGEPGLDKIQEQFKQLEAIYSNPEQEIS